MSSEYILEINSLNIEISGREIISDLSLSVPCGSRYALVGESGSGKSITSLAILDLLPSKAIIKNGVFKFNREDITERRNEYRGQQISYIPQNPINSLNPIRTAEGQIRETIQYHYPELTESETRERIYQLLEQVQLKDKAEQVLESYPFELSGGMCQRVLIAMALIPSPSLIIADEPTTALDVTTQAEIIRLLTDLVEHSEMSMILITHDLPLVANSCEYISILQNGQVKESGTVREIFKNPQDEYTQELLNCARVLQ